MSELLQGWKRTHLCSEPAAGDVGKLETLMGWVDCRRDLGALLFVDLRDKSGIMQVVFDSGDLDAECFARAEQIRSEFVIAVRGSVVKRAPETVNEKLKTGEIELRVKEFKILSKSETPPFYIEDGVNVQEMLRLKHRYLDLRRPEMQKTLALRHKLAKIARDYFDQSGFLEIETPMLGKSTPEGARDYLVPSRVHSGAFYALPQSPQLYKQLLMVSGFDRYFQIARCFRDEDLRADRQPEFTQIDVEMSFVDVDDIIAMNEGLLARLFKDAMGIDIQLPIKRLPYKEAMERIGSDKPDTRFGLELKDLSDIAKTCGFQVFSSAVERGGSVRAINAKGCVEKFARREIDALVDFVKIYKAKGMAWISITSEGLKSPITKFLTEEETNAIISRLGGEPGDILFFIADSDEIVFDCLGNLRLELARKLSLFPEGNVYDLLWVTEFPLLEWDAEEKRFAAKHHPFTSPMDEDISLLDTDPGKVRAKAYDIVLNGNEIGGGSIRIHSVELQEKMLGVLGFSMEKAWNSFGFLMEAIKYGPPPHGGIAYGLDRLTMLLGNRSSIRDTIAFPKIQNATCPLTNAPGEVELKQLRELHIRATE